MKKVVLVNQSSGYLMVDIVNAYAGYFDEVVLIAGSVKQMERRLSSRVKIERIISYHRNSSLSRILSWCYGSLEIFFLLLFRYRSHEIVYVTNPPMAYLSSLVLKRKFSVIVFDIYPNALKNIGIGEKNWIYRRWQNWNRKVFKSADRLITLSASMAKVLESYVEPAKIRVIPNWSGSEKIHPIEKSQNPFITANQLDNKFVIMYSGNIGYSHPVELMTDLADRLKEESDIHFLIIGDGKKKAFLSEQIQKKQLSNCTILPWQPAHVLPYSLACADLAMVTISDDLGRLSVPSKTYNLLSAGVPLLGIAPQESELAHLIAGQGNGRCFNPDQVDQVSEYILNLSKDRQEQKKLSARSGEAAKEYHYHNALLYLQ